MRTLFALAAVLLLLAGGGCDEPAAAPPAGANPRKVPVKENRLAQERSPYLRQHKLNPVDWYPWGPEAFARAKAEDKPVFLSVGYAACHWCHVMEHESFEDEATAKAMNAAFVCVKVDREERPDVDRVYMQFVQMRTGRGGWPMTVLLTPDGRPFWGATYLPAEGVRQLCASVSAAWREHRSDLEQTATAYAERVAELGAMPDVPATDDSDAQILETMRNALGARFDSRHGGYGDHPKFPPHTELLYFLDEGGRRMGQEERRQVLATLDGMERGGIHDQVGGGFHRYSTDARWLLPHFEKMLYDNALLAQAYAGAYALTQDARYRRVVERLLAWLEREMKQPGGGYASSLDADTQGEEGLTYTWTWAELEAALEPAQLDVLASLYGLGREGNFHDEATQRATGRNIPHLPRPLAEVAAERGGDARRLRAESDALLETLRAVRDRRPQPGLDDKVITAWNGLLVSAFARAGRDLQAPAYLERGRALAAFLLEHCRRPDGTLLRFPRGSGPEIPAFAEDHVHLADGLLDLAACTGEERWAQAARELIERLNAEFQDVQGGGFHATSTQRHETLFARSKEAWDSPIPSENGVAARANLRLFARTGEEAFRHAADRTLSAFRPVYAHPRMVTGTMALVRALTMRMEMEAAGADVAVTGDVRLHRDVTQVDVYGERARSAPGRAVRLLVRVRLDAGWHAGGAGGTTMPPVRLEVGEGSPAALEAVQYPVAVLRALGPAGEAPVPVHEGVFDIRAELVVPADASPGPRRIPLVLHLQVCSETLCKPSETLHLDLPLRFAAEDGEARHPTLFR